MKQVKLNLPVKYYTEEIRKERFIIKGQIFYVLMESLISSTNFKF